MSQPYRTVVEVRARNGTMRIIDVTMVQMVLEARTIIFMAGRDLTHRHQMQQEIDAAQNQFRQVVDNIGEAFWMMPADRSRFDYLNPAVERLTGIPNVQLREDPTRFFEQIHPADCKLWLTEALGDEHHPPKPISLRVRLLREGEEHWVWARGWSIVDETGQMVARAGLLSDITELVQNEQAVAETRHRLQVVANDPASQFAQLLATGAEGVLA